MFDKKQFPLGSISANEKSSTNTQIHFRKPLCLISYM